MKTESYASVISSLRAVNMNERARARAEAGARASATIVELLLGMAGIIGLRSKHSDPA